MYPRNVDENHVFMRRCFTKSPYPFCSSHKPKAKRQKTCPRKWVIAAASCRSGIDWNILRFLSSPLFCSWSLYLRHVNPRLMIPPLIWFISALFLTLLRHVNPRLIPPLIRFISALFLTLLTLCFVKGHISHRRNLQSAPTLKACARRGLIVFCLAIAITTKHVAWAHVENLMSRSSRLTTVFIRTSRASSGGE